MTPNTTSNMAPSYDQMTEDQRAAYDAAVAAIRKAEAAGETTLSLWRPEDNPFKALTAIPPEIASLTALQTLDLEGTQVQDLAPLASLTALQSLDLAGTQVQDLAPLASLTALQSLDLRSTQVQDLTPLASLTALQRLILRSTQVQDLAPLASLTALQTLYLRSTQVQDLTPLASLTALQRLDLRSTQVQDLAPLASLTALQSLILSGTQVQDLRPLLALDLLWDKAGEQGPSNPYIWATWFSDTPATEADPKLKELSEINDHKSRTQQTRDYLRNLPPYPQPLPWLVPPKHDAPPPSPPEPEAPPRVLLTQEMRIDTEDATATAADLSDPIKSRLYGQLRTQLETLHRFGNRYPEVAGPVAEMQAITGEAFAEADLLGLHLQALALDDIRRTDGERRDAEQLDPDCRRALDQVLRLAPAITIGNDEVDLLQERLDAFALRKASPTEAEGERRVAGSVADTKDHTTDRAQRTATLLSTARDDGRLAAPRRGFVQGVLVAVAGAYVLGPVGAMGDTQMRWALEFLINNKDAIWAAAQGWGDLFMAWTADMMARANEMLQAIRDRDTR